MHLVYDFREDLAPVADADLVQRDEAVATHVGAAREVTGVIVDVAPDTFVLAEDDGNRTAWPLRGSLLSYRRGRRCRLLCAEPSVLGFGPRERLAYVTLESIVEVWVETHGLTPTEGVT
jgi:hypothetical protein